MYKNIAVLPLPAKVGSGKNAALLERSCPLAGLALWQRLWNRQGVALMGKKREAGQSLLLKRDRLVLRSAELAMDILTVKCRPTCDGEGVS